MNILYLCADPGIPIRGHKGAAIHVRALCDALAALGHRVTLLTPRAGPAGGPSPQARLLEIAAPAVGAAVLTAEQQEQRSRDVARAICRAGDELLSREHFDFIYERYSLWSDAGASLARTGGPPLVVEVNAPLRIEAARFRMLCLADKAAEIETSLLSAASAVAVVSGPLRDYVIGRGVSADRVHVLPNAVDERLFHPAVSGRAVRTRLGLEERFVVGFAGTVKPWHDIDTLIAAMVRLREQGETLPYHLLLVGDIPPAVRDALAQRGLADATTIVGPLPHDEVPVYLAAMDVAVSPHPAMDGFYFSPLKLFEYMACGVATVVSDVPSIAEIVTDGVTAVLYPAGDAAALADRISGLASSRRLRAHLAWEGASHVLRRHTWQRNARQVLEWVAPPPLRPEEPPREQLTLPLLDDELRTCLFMATRADLAGPHLAAHLSSNGSQAPDRVEGLEVLKYKPGRRCVLAYNLQPAGSGNSPLATAQRVVGKVFRDERGARHLALHEALRADGFGAQADDGITVAEPLAYIPEMHMFLQERAPGCTLDDSLGAPDFDDRVRHCAVAIAKLHASPIQPPARYTLEEHLASLDDRAEELAAYRPGLTGAFARQVGRLHAWAAALPQADPVPAHRDFYYSQVLFARDRVTLIDLDLFALADPAVDVANFAAHLRLLAIQRLPDPAALDATAALFVQHYTQQAPQPPGFAERLAFYEASTYFRLMHVVLQRPRQHRRFEPLFELCESGPLLLGPYGG